MEDKMIGLWEVQELSFQGQNYKDSIRIPIISIDDDKIILPEIEDLHPLNHANWDVIEYSKTDSIRIISENKMFNGNYMILYTQDSNDELIHCSLISKQTTLILNKIDLFPE
ncbi:hypothetical protein [uncultured Psychroserpens sp.]|uniref:hypothetical protein n=1 Tax=uncultured Psychroserpens sp. TaxID=255436 RepID=UPI00260CC0E2|nr:hypothetical protein [uncultured Psychroserpens sp.]